ncbi:MAG: flagellar biosynthesis protein FliQ [Desulfovibrio sp.]|nr:flagellar biosynthesis protein FliQ [Desulfovibrio sp.]MCA1985534.1 flagellar biosynthesis protein FliQ [Desulfovibrio sp.]
MSPDFVIGFAKGAIELTLELALPILLVSLVVGVVVSVLQAATQIQEQTLSFIPKIVSIFIAFIVTFPWLLEKITTYATQVFVNIPIYIR